MPPSRFHLAPHSLTFAADDHQRNRWTLAAYIAAIDAGGQLNHQTHQAAIREGRRLDAETGFRWWVLDTAGKLDATPASGAAIA